jgi:hypothetical protein
VPRAVFAVEDVPSYNALAPVAAELDFETEFLFVDGLYGSQAAGEDRRIPEEIRERHDYRDFEEYVTRRPDLFARFPEGAGRAVAQKLVVDAADYGIAYDVAGYLADADPDVFVCAMDSLPFVRHVIAALRGEAPVTAVVQGGMYPKNLTADRIATRHGALSPGFSGGALERLKRRLAYRYGITVYCHPDVDYAFTLGSFFAERIAGLREGYPYDGHTELVVTGAPEYEGPAREYDPTADSVLFLSQQQWESGRWSDGQLETARGMLARLDRNVPVTVRPHPKDSEEKRAFYGERVAVSEEPDLAADVANHDVILTSHSTAVLEGVIQGKPAGIVEFPWESEVALPDFPAFAHEHLLRIEDGTEDVGALAAERSVATQRDYLERFCRVPFGDGETPSERIAGRLRRAAPVRMRGTHTGRAGGTGQPQ